MILTDICMIIINWHYKKRIIYGDIKAEDYVADILQGSLLLFVVRMDFCILFY